MKTNELVTLLATGAGAVEPDASSRRYATALGWGAFGATLLMAILVPVRPDIDAAAQLPMFWIKLAFPASVAVGGLFAASRLSRPGARLGWVSGALVAPVLAMWLLTAYVLLGAPPEERADLVMGFTWEYCLLYIPTLSVPVLVATLWAMKGLAPTRLALAGAAAGLLAGALGALVYALHCPEMEAPFLGVWYVAAMLIPAAAGALLGPIVLRW
ncbi:MAG TPA: DUF1109 domain-containing protein [Casimicrobiaceae bacterium]|jgi:hypothetical protein|nr:DUF1109 domain-containing protein [Casimicrobiaceae bacterium]